ncbi:MAG: hypothetical protein ABIO46_02810 [Chitinophagales bacterium]
MRKIKFKTEYVPLSDDVINRHKNFDQLMSAYVTAPKPNWFKQFIQKKWTMFGGGLISGAIITSLLWYSQDITPVNTPVVQETKNRLEIQETPKNMVAPVLDSSMKLNPDVTDKNNSSVKNDVVKQNTAPVTIAVKSENDKQAAAATAPPFVANNSQRKPNEESVKYNNASTVNASPVLEEEKMPAVESIESAASPTEANVEAPEVAEKLNPVVEDNTQTAIGSIAVSSDSFSSSKTEAVNNNSIQQEQVALIGPIDLITTADTADSSVAKTEEGEKKNSNNNLVPEILAGAAIVSPPAVAPAIPSAKEKKGKSDTKTEKNSGNDSSATAFLNLNIFHRDSSKNEIPKEEKKGWLVFGKDSSAQKNVAGGGPIDSAKASGKSPAELSQDSLYIPRYAQVSFVTPLSSNGIDGYKYMHFVSLNVLQGYNGALKGAEFGGLMNGIKGYVAGAQFGGLANYAGGNLTGAQFAGLANYTGGYVKGAQFGGLANVGQSLRGAQFAGITNISGSYVSGFQAAGIVNIAADSLNGAQIAGIVNLSSSDKKSHAWQIAGVGNVSLSQTKGGQIGGVFNLANDLVGGQIGLINLGKKISGFQIGLINISDSLDGAAIGLVSVSSDGIFDVDGWTSDILTFNGAIRVGTKYMYNIYAYGVSPFNTDLPFGFGVGIGGHIPIKQRAFVDIDGMAWSMHRSYVSFSAINMINQLRVMGGFKINKYLSVFAGPTFNVSVQDNRYEPFLDNHFYENVSENTTVRLAPGFVAGIHIF